MKVQLKNGKVKEYSDKFAMLLIQKKIAKLYKVKKQK